MSEHLRLSSPASSSPGRLTSISRPDWPWAARSYSRRSQPNSPHPPSSVQGSSLQIGWDPRLSTSSSQSVNSVSSQKRNTGTPKPVTNMSFQSTSESTRQWSFTGFEWAIQDIHKLRDYVEGVEALPLDDGTRRLRPELDDFEVLKQSPTIGDHRFKLEIAAMSPPDVDAPTLVLYITSLMLDFAQEDYEYPTSMMAGIKCQNDRVGEKGSRPEWVWEFWHNDWVFRREREVWECPLPSLSTLLENPRIKETDSMVLCIQIHSPAGPAIPQQPSVYYVPRDLLDGLEASLDNPNTGDVRFVCLEKYVGNGDSPVLSPTQSTGSGLSDSTSLFSSHAVARKRIIYAHSDILIRRSEYFATMLSSSFSENPTISNGERKVYTIVVEEADFKTVYWLLKYCYANWLLFKEDDDPRVAVEGVGAGWSARWLTGQQGEWDWKVFHRSGPGASDSTAENRSTVSGESLPNSATVSRSTSRKSDDNRLDSSPSVATSSGVTTARLNTVKQTSPHITGTNPRAAGTSSVRTGRPAVSSGSGSLGSVGATGSGTSSNISRSKPISIPVTNNQPSSKYSVPLPTHTTRKANIFTSVADPHTHPTPAPSPASALSIYQVAHRYTMPNLAALALEHIMSTITPQSSFALLLATSLWDDLHTLIEDFVIEHWDEVHVTSEFEQCLSEVSAGEWGPDGGKTLMSVFRRLRSPN